MLVFPAEKHACEDSIKILYLTPHDLEPLDEITRENGVPCVVLSLDKIVPGVVGVREGYKFSRAFSIHH